MLPIVEQDDPRYFALRAKEMIGEAQLALGFGSKPNSQQIQQYHLKMTQAISLLALARVTIGMIQESEGAPRT